MSDGRKGLLAIFILFFIYIFFFITILFVWLSGMDVCVPLFVDLCVCGCERVSACMHVCVCACAHNTLDVCE